MIDDELEDGTTIGRRRGNDLSGLDRNFGRPLAGRRVLVAEDNVILSMHVAELLESAGAEVVGPYPFADDALGAVNREAPDAAVLDHELMGGTSDVVADRLTELGVPFAFFTSHAREDVTAASPDVPMVGKPSGADDLLSAVTSILKN